MKSQERERRPHRPLQLQVHQVLETVGRECEYDPREDAGAAAPGQVAREREHRRTRGGDRAEQQQVVHQDRLHAGP